MRGRTGGLALAAITSIALVATACGGGGTEPESEASQPGGQAGGEIVDSGCTPENPLIPGNTSEVCGGDIIDAMTAKLVQYNTETAAPENDIAESIETNDNQTFTVKLKPGYKFHDGTEVKAKNFVDAWNYTAYGPNGQAGSYFYAPIAGLRRRAVRHRRRECDCEGKPQGQDDVRPEGRRRHTFTIKTTEPVSNLPVRLGYSAFAPLPDSFFADPKAFEKKPIGAGPFKLDADQQHRVRALQVRRLLPAQYKPNVDKLTFRIYQDRRRPTPTRWPAASTTSTTATSRRTSSSATRTRPTSRTGTVPAGVAASSAWI